MYFYSSPNSTPNIYYTYNVCSKILCSDIKIESLSSFFERQTKSIYKDRNTNIINQHYFVPIYEGPGIIGDSVREISFYGSNDNFIIIIEDIGKFLISQNLEDTEILLLESNFDINNNLIIESLLGPVLIFCLALQRVFCLHASAVEYKNQAILFIGKSGSGKSTIAEYVDNNSDEYFTRIADDIMPVVIENDIAYALPHFPRLKLPNDKQYSKDSPSKVAISANYILNRDNRRKSVDIKELNSTEKFLTLISNTVASRLFDKELNKKHLNFCSHAASKVIFKEITYPHNKQILPIVENVILEVC